MICGKNEGLSFSINDTGQYFDFLQLRGVDFMPRLVVRSYPDGNFKLRGAHLCVPFFGQPPKSSSLRGKIAQHGEFRLRDFPLFREGENGVSSKFELGGDQAGYRWRLFGSTSYEIVQENSLRIVVELWRQEDGIDGAAPVNIGVHFYWRNLDGVGIRMGNFQKFVAEPVPDSEFVSYAENVFLDIPRVGKVEMEMGGTHLVEPQVVIWSDKKDFTCVELVMSNSDLFDTSGGIGLFREIEAGQEKKSRLKFECLLKFSL